VNVVILTGGTDTALGMLRHKPGLNLLAETGGKNATIVTAMSAMRLSRSRLAMVRMRRQRKGVEPVHVRVLSFDPPQEHPFQDRNLIILNRFRNTEGRYKWL